MTQGCYMCPKHICGNANTRCQWAVNTDLQDIIAAVLFHLNRSERTRSQRKSSDYQKQHGNYSKTSRQNLSPEQDWGPAQSAWHWTDPGKHINFLKNNSSLMSAWPFLVSNPAFSECFGESKQIIQPVRGTELYSNVYVRELLERNTVFPHTIYMGKIHNTCKNEMFYMSISCCVSITFYLYIQGLLIEEITFTLQ